MKKNRSLQTQQTGLPVIPNINDEIFERTGITKDDRARMLKKLFDSTEKRLGAMHVKVFNHNGVVITSDPLVDHGTRGKAIDQAMQLVGLQKQEAPKVVIKANVVLPDWANPKPVDITPGNTEDEKESK